jgi:FAD/FMN-containing dehydrogenase
VLWERLGTEGIVGLLTPGERLAAQALKRELDPSGLLNPHIAFTG